MHRRIVLKMLAGGGAAMAFAPELLAFLKEAQGKIGPGYTLQALSPSQNETIIRMTDLIIPETETPGAKAAKVSEFIDLILAEWCTAEEKEEFLEGLEAAERRTQQLFGRSFAECTEAQQTEILRLLDEECAVMRGGIVRAQPRKIAGRKTFGCFFTDLKWLTLRGYYTSEIGFSQELHEEIIPGEFLGCVPAVKS